jgi:hypothetical protein
MLRGDLRVEATDLASCSINPIFWTAERDVLQSSQITQLKIFSD